MYNEKLKSITLPNSVEEIGAAAFANSNFESITLSTSLKSIPTEAFKGCRRLTKLTIPTSVTEIKDNVFTGCAQLKEITFLCPAPTFTTNDLDENRPCRASTTRSAHVHRTQGYEGRLPQGSQLVAQKPRS